MLVANKPHAGLRQGAEHAAQRPKTFGRACEEITW